MKDEVSPSDLYLLEIQKLNKKVDDLNNMLINHINFIENVYNMVHAPLLYIVNKINNNFLLNDK